VPSCLSSSSKDDSNRDSPTPLPRRSSRLQPTSNNFSQHASTTFLENAHGFHNEDDGHPSTLPGGGDAYDQDVPSDTESSVEDEEERESRELLENAGLFAIPVDQDTSVLACIECRKGIMPFLALSHVTSSPHRLKLNKKEKKMVEKWIRDNHKRLARWSQDLPDVLPLQHEAPIVVLPTYKGFACTECAHCTRKMSSLMKHWTKTHKSVKHDYPEARYTEELVQAHFTRNPKYFAVNPVLKGEGRSSVVRLYIEKYSKEINAPRPNGELGPISPMEVPPLLQETQWAAHLQTFINTGRTGVLRELTRLPTGKAADENPLGDTLRCVIVRYMKCIRQKALKSPLQVRELLYPSPLLLPPS